MESKENLIKNLRKKIESSRNTIYRQVNTKLLKMYLYIGEKISESLNNKTRNAEKGWQSHQFQKMVSVGLS